MTDYINDFDGDPGDEAFDEAEELSALSRTHSRLIHPRSAMSHATIRARCSATLPTRRKTPATEHIGPNASSTVLHRVDSYRKYVLGAAAALLALIAVVRQRRSSTSQTVDLSD